jgi:hypothetical protein
MTRADYLVAVGDTEHPPTEQMWQELEAEINQIKRTGDVPGLTDREALATDSGTQAIAAWKLRNNLVR